MAYIFSGESGKAQPDKIIPERLRESNLILIKLLETTIDAITSKLVLAEQLLGVSAAVSDIVRSLAPEMAMHNDILRRYEDDQLDGVSSGRMFMVLPGRYHLGASLLVHSLDVTGKSTGYGVCLPTNQQLRALLKDDPIFWHDMTAHIQDFRTGTPQLAYPFHDKLYKEGADRQYFALLQELSVELLLGTAEPRE